MRLNKDSVKDKTKRAAGKVRETAGKVTGNEETQARGRVDQVKGSAQEAWGGAKQGVKDLSNKARESKGERRGRKRFVTQTTPGFTPS